MLDETDESAPSGSRENGEADRGGQALSVRNLTVDFGGYRAVERVGFDVAMGSVTALIGANGAGKTTTFNAIGGFVAPTTHDVMVEGQRLPPMEPYAAWELGIGRTFQKLELFWTLTVRETLELAAWKARGINRLEVGTNALIEQCGLADVADAVVARLPLGTNRVVELARALATGARVLMLDEPSSGLDSRETTEFAETVTRTRESFGYSTLLIEHDMDLVMELATAIVVVDFGRVLAVGSPQEIRESPLVRKAYLGTTGTDVGAAS